MSSPTTRPLDPSNRPALDLIALARQSPEVSRKNLRSLLLANPNYFGNLSASTFKAVLNIQEDITYECIGGVGYDPELGQIRSVIKIKQSAGYSEPGFESCSVEYVRFYMSQDGGLVWRDQGLRAFKVADVDGQKPPQYFVAIPVTPTEELRFAHNVLRVRAILSWSSAPPQNVPNWIPVFGNVAEAEIHIEASRFNFHETVVNAAALELPPEVTHALGWKHGLENSGTVPDSSGSSIQNCQHVSLLAAAGY